MSSLLTRLNDEQLAAVSAPGNVLLVACPGSGKTRALVQKVANELSLLEGHREIVVALTYTHVAADEIRERVQALGVDTRQLWVGTIHSFCLEWILRPYSIYHPALRKGFAVLDTHAQEELLEQLARKNGLSGRFKCKYFATANGYEVDATTPVSERPKVELTISEFYETLNNEGLIDFEMMLKYAYDLITSHTPIARRLAQLFKVIAVDEYQDTRMIQYQILSRIFRVPHSLTRLFMVGDPNQAIFTSLGGVALPHSQLEILLGAKVSAMRLSKNYRSSQQIVDYFSLYEVDPSEIEAVGPNRSIDGLITYNRTVRYRDNLYDYIANLIRYNVEVLAIAPSEVCIVAPWWEHLSPLTRALVERLPDYDFDGPGLSPFGQNKDNFWYKVARIALSEPSPRRYFSRINWAHEVIELLEERGVLSGGLDAKALLKVTNSISIIADTGPEYLKLFFAEFITRLDIQLRDNDEYDLQRRHFFERMENRIQRIMNKEGIDISSLQSFKQVFRSRTGVVLSTVHGVKGEEYDTVIAFALLEGALPHFAEQDKSTAAKRALFVAGSRARKHLHLISESGRLNGYGGPYHPTKALVRTHYAYSADPAQ